MKWRPAYPDKAGIFSKEQLKVQEVQSFEERRFLPCVRQVSYVEKTVYLVCFRLLISNPGYR